MKIFHHAFNGAGHTPVHRFSNGFFIRPSQGFHRRFIEDKTCTVIRVVVSRVHLQQVGLDKITARSERHPHRLNKIQFRRNSVDGNTFFTEGCGSIQTIRPLHKTRTFIGRRYGAHPRHLQHRRLHIRIAIGRTEISRQDQHTGFVIAQVLLPDIIELRGNDDGGHHQEHGNHKLQHNHALAQETARGTDADAGFQHLVHLVSGENERRICARQYADDQHQCQHEGQGLRRK